MVKTKTSIKKRRPGQINILYRGSKSLWKALAIYFYGFWDDKKLLDGILKEHPERKSNLVLVAKGQDS